MVAASASTSHASVAPEKNVNPRPSRIEEIAQPRRRVDLPHHEVEERGQEERRRSEHVRELAATRVGDDPGRDLEDHLAESEERVRRESLGVVQPGVEQEDRVDAVQPAPPEPRARQAPPGPLALPERPARPVPLVPLSPPVPR